MELGDVRARVGSAAQAVLDRNLEHRDRVVVAAAVIVGAGEVGVALGHPQAARVGEDRQLVEDRPGLIEIASLQGLLKAHSEWIPQQPRGVSARARNLRT